MNHLVSALLDELDDDALAELARRLVPHLPAAPVATDDLLDSVAAAAYLACKPHRLRKLVYERRLTAQKDGSRLLFRRSDIDAYLARGAGTKAVG